MLFPAAKLLLRMYVGYPNGWKYLSTVGTLDFSNSWFAIFPATLLGVAFSNSFASRRAYGQRVAEITSGHFDSACMSMVVV
jgi:hypothetical protein